MDCNTPAQCVAFFKTLKNSGVRFTLKYSDKKIECKLEKINPNDKVLTFRIIDPGTIRIYTKSFEVRFTYKELYYKFADVALDKKSDIIKLSIPNKISSHQARSANRFRVKGAQVDFKLSVSELSKKELDNELRRIKNRHLEEIFIELNRCCPNVQLLCRKANELLSEISDIHKVKLGVLSDLSYPAQKILEKTGKPLLVTNTLSVDMMLSDRTGEHLALQFSDFLAVEKRENSSLDIWDEAKRWQSRYQKRGVASELTVPVIISGSVVGYLYAASKDNALRPIGSQALYLLSSLSENISEAIVKRSLNGKADVHKNSISIYDISETGIGFCVTEPIFVKLLRINQRIKISFDFQYKKFSLFGDVVRTIPLENNNTGAGVSFSVEIDFLFSSSKERIYFKRLLNYLKEGGK